LLGWRDARSRHPFCPCHRYARPARGSRWHSFCRRSVRFVKQQLLILNRSRQRSPNLRSSDRLVAGLRALLIGPARLIRSASVLKPSTLLNLHRNLRNPLSPACYRTAQTHVGAGALASLKARNLATFFQRSIDLPTEHWKRNYSDRVAEDPVWIRARVLCSLMGPIQKRGQGGGNSLASGYEGNSKLQNLHRKKMGSGFAEGISPHKFN
jgi:hypothetical protein